MSVKGQIKRMAGAWNQAKENVGDYGDFVPVESGSYHMQLVKAEIRDFGDQRKIMHKWCVVGHDGDDNGKVCTDFEGIDDPDRLVWLQRMLQALGVDLDEVEVNSEDDLLAIFDDLIAERTVAKVRVTEKGGYTNMRVQKVVDLGDDDLLVDPDEVFASSGRDSQSDDDEDEDEDEDEDGYELSVGDGVSWSAKNGKIKVGKIKSIDEEQETAAVVQEGKKNAVTIDIDDLQLVQEDNGEDDGDSSTDTEVEEDEDEVSVGDEVFAPIGSKGKMRAGKVVKVHKKTGTCDVKYDTPSRRGATHAKGVKFDDLEHRIDDDE